DLITDFVSANDAIEVSGAAGDGTNYSEAGAAASNFAAAQTAANAVFAADQNNAIYNLQFVGDTGYLFVNTDDGTTADAVIKLTGINNTNFGSSDIVAV